MIRIPLKELIVSYNFDSSIVPDHQVKNYMVGLWFQQHKNGTLEAFTPVPCTELPELAETLINDGLERAIEDYYCPDMHGKDIKLQNSLSGTNAGSQKFFLAVDTCQNF